MVMWNRRALRIGIGKKISKIKNSITNCWKVALSFYKVLILKKICISVIISLLKKFIMEI